MKFAIGSRAYGKNSPFLAESDCFFDCLRKKEAEYDIIARKRVRYNIFRKNKKEPKRYRHAHKTLVE